MPHAPANPARAAARKASPARATAAAAPHATPPHRPGASPGRGRSQQRAALLVDTPEQKSLKAITSRVLEALKNPSAVPSQIILAALKEARAV